MEISLCYCPSDLWHVCANHWVVWVLFILAKKKVKCANTHFSFSSCIYLHILSSNGGCSIPEEILDISCADNVLVKENLYWECEVSESYYFNTLLVTEL